MKKRIFIWVLALIATRVFSAEPANLVANGSFESSRRDPGEPDFWAAAGNPKIKQQLATDLGRDGRQCARLTCTEFNGDGPDFHAMICQAGKVGVTRGKWYRLKLWAKADRLAAGAVEVALVNTRPWDNAGLADAFLPSADWQPFTILFRARNDLPPDASRLQFWFKGTGSLWLDDVELTESSEGQQWFPQLPTDAVKNFIPNSSFECGGANWGSLTYGLKGWAGNLYRLEGQLDPTVAYHGRASLKLALTPETLPVFYFDYYDPVRQPVRRVLAANQGWCKVSPGKPLTLSAWLRADAERTIAQLAANEAPEHLLRKDVTVGTNWQRHAFTFRPQQPFLFIAVGLDLDASRRPAATLWIDAIQLEKDEQPTAYEPRQPVESFLESSVPGNIFTNVTGGAHLALRAFNNTDRPQPLRGQLTATDFFDRTVLQAQPSFDLPPQLATSFALAEIGTGRRGFYRVNWSGGTSTQSLRCAIIDPLPPGATDSPLGFNHAYPWDFLVQLARQAGILWWRDWSAKWQTIEPSPGRFDFTLADQQIHRILDLDSEVEVLLPFPSALWSTTAPKDEVKKAAGDNAYLQTRLPAAYAPKDVRDFAHYAAETVRHYRHTPPRSDAPRSITTYQLLNEPVYTSYALPRQFGYSLSDYLRLLEAAWEPMKSADPNCRIVGGISAHLEAGLTRDFVLQGGLKFVDVLDLHLYDPARSAESFEPAFESLANLMQTHGGPKPVWITEWGCYADDDPPCVPYAVGDDTMNRCRWPSERAATEHIVKFTAIGFAHGLRKLFFHAGTCGSINGPDAAGVLFEYGGCPRKMYPGAAALTLLLGVPQAGVARFHENGLSAYIFRTHDQFVGIAWHKSETKFQRPSPLRIFDLMGNELTGTEFSLNNSPVYLTTSEPDLIQHTLAGN